MEKKFEVGNVVESLSGHDKGKPYIIVKEQDGYYYIANGKERKYVSPKKKSPKHIKFLSVGEKLLTERIKQGQEIGNETIKKALWPYNQK